MRIALLVVASMALSPSLAIASTVSVIKATLYSQTKGSPGRVVVWRAAAGERNNLSLRVDTDGWILRDEAAQIVPGTGCRARPDGAVTCRHAGGPLRFDAGDGDDTIVLSLLAGASMSLSTVDGGDGDDTIRLEGAFGGSSESPYGSQYPELYGGRGNDTLYGGSYSTDLYGLVGDDTLVGGGSHDRLWGDAGDDRLDGGAGDDDISGGSDIDRLSGGAGDDELDGEDGEDAIDGGPGEDALTGGAGADVLSGDAGDDTLDGDVSSAVFRFVAAPAADRLDGGEGRDRASYAARRTPVTIDLGAGIGGAPGEADTLVGVEDATGGLAADVVIGDDGPNALSGGAPTDVFHGSAPHYGIENSTGFGDRVEGNGGDDRLDGGSSAGYPGRLDGGEGNDRLTWFGATVADAGPGDDVLDGTKWPRRSAGRLLCGDGRDLVEHANRRDEARADCETIQAGPYRVQALSATGRSMSLTLSRVVRTPAFGCVISAAITGVGPRQAVLAQRTVRMAPQATRLLSLRSSRPLPVRVRVALRALQCGPSGAPGQQASFIVMPPGSTRPPYSGRPRRSGVGSAGASVDSRPHEHDLHATDPGPAALDAGDRGARGHGCFRALRTPQCATRRMR